MKHVIILVVVLCLILFIIECSSREKYQKNDMVVSRCTENVECIIKKYSNSYNIIVYDKCDDSGDNKIPNIGRESHTYLHHIVHNWEKGFPDVTIFLIGSSCRDEYKTNQMNAVLDKVTETGNSVFIGFETDPESLSNFKIDEWHGIKMDVVEDERPYSRWAEKYVKKDMSPIYTWNGIFAVHRNHVLNNTKEYYQNLLNSFPDSPNPEIGHFLERAWPQIFGPLPKECMYLTKQDKNLYKPPFDPVI